MKELINEMNKIAGNDDSAFINADPYQEFRDAAKQWASYCIQHLDDAAVEKGLMISIAIARWCNHMSSSVIHV